MFQLLKSKKQNVKNAFQFFAFLCVCLCALSAYSDHQLGDLAPRGATDGVLNAGDLVIMQRLATGDLAPIGDELIIGDVAPLNASDGLLNAADVLILQRAVLGQVTLGTVEIAPPTPVLDPVTVTPTNENPYTVSGTSVANATIDIYLDGTLVKTTTALPNGSFSTTIVLNEGPNSIQATANTGGDTSPLSVPPLAVTFQMNNGGVISNIPAGTTTLFANTIYSVSTNLTVDIGETLIIEHGALLEFAGGGITLNGGELVISGLANRPAILTSSDIVTPAVGDWDGITVSSLSANITIDNAEIAYAAIGVYFNGGGDAGVISSTYIHDAFTGILVSGPVSPTISSGNTITLNTRGLLVLGSGMGDPSPVVTGNSIHSNSLWNYSADNFTDLTIKLNATGNWWGSSVPDDIAATIFDFNDDNQAPFESPAVDFGLYLNAEGGSQVPGNYLTGPINGNVSLTGDTEYIVIGKLKVENGAIYTINPGATLKFINTGIEVDGNLQILGDATNKVRLTSFNPVPAKGSWQGININNTSANTVIDNAVIEWATTGVTATGSINTTISNSEIKDNQASGVSYLSGADGLITNNVITGHTGSPNTGIYIQQSLPSITNNEVIGNYYGIWIDAASPSVDGNLFSSNEMGVRISGANANPVFTFNSIVFNDSYGIWIQGTGNDVASAQPRFNNNDIYSNRQASASTPYDVWITGYSASSAISIDFSQNWWGEIVPNMSVRLLGQASLVDSSAPLNTQVGATTIMTGITVSESVISPYNADGVKDAVIFSGVLNNPVNWKVTVNSLTSGVVRTYLGGGISVNVSWDGYGEGSLPLPDGEYYFDIKQQNDDTIAFIDTAVYSSTLDNTAPSVNITNPGNGDLLQSGTEMLSILGTATDINFSSYTLEYRPVGSVDPWVTISNNVPTPVQNAELGIWTVIVNVPNLYTQLDSGGYDIRLMSMDDVGNTSSVQISVTLDYIKFDNVTQDKITINPTAGETVVVQFDISKPAAVTMRVFAEIDDALVYEGSKMIPIAGKNTISWSGKSTGDTFIPDEAYYYELVANDINGAANYRSLPPGSIVPGVNGTNPTVDFNVEQNVSWSSDITINDTQRFNLSIFSAGTEYPVFVSEPHEIGQTRLYWDGRSSSGQPIAAGSYTFAFAYAASLPTNTVIIKGTKPNILGDGIPPNIEVKSNPYNIRHSYGEFSQINFQIDQDSTVTIKLLPPGIYDPSNPLAIVLMSATSLNADVSPGVPQIHSVEWIGNDGVDTNQILLDQEGAYTFTIEAVGSVTGYSSLYRGSLSIYR